MCLMWSILGYLYWIDLFSSCSCVGCGPERSCQLYCIHSSSGIFGGCDSAGTASVIDLAGFGIHLKMYL